MELQLEENPWNCTCEIVQLKLSWSSIPYTALVGDITCETPFHFYGKDLRKSGKQNSVPCCLTLRWRLVWGFHCRKQGECMAN